MLALGVYPIVSLADARIKRDAARKLLSDGIDPSAQRKAKKQTAIAQNKHTFELISREWFIKHKTNWAASHSSKLIGRLERYVFPHLGQYAIETITSVQLLDVIRQIEEKP